MNIISNWKTYLKFLSRNKGYTAIDLFGLSVSLMFVLLIGVYTWQEFSTDRFHEKKDRIYLFGSSSMVNSSASLVQSLQAHYPEIESVCAIHTNTQPNTPVESEGRRLGGDVMFADSTFFTMFSFPLLQGNAREVLVASNQAVITQEFARKLFGTDNAIGRQVVLMDSLRLTVSGVVKDLKHSCIPESDIILPLKMLSIINSAYDPTDVNNSTTGVSFVLVHNGINPNDRAADMLAWLKTSNRIYEQGKIKDVHFTKLTDYYFSNLYHNGYLQTGDKRFVLVLMSVGILILVFAVLNYINLTVAQAGFRAKEMATRRLLGSTRMELFWRLMSESTLMCFIALSIAWMFIFTVEPFANDLLQTRLDLTILFSPAWIGISLLGVLVVGALAGWLPATVISNAKPIEVVRGTLRTKTKMVYSKVFITFQNFITIVMLACSLVMILQISHLLHAPVGYNTKNLYAVMTAFNSPSQTDAFADRLRQMSGVSRVGLTQGLPFWGANNMGCSYVDGGIKHNIHFYQYPMDKTCFEMLGLNIKHDNHLANPEWYLNEEAMRQMNLPMDAPTFTLDGQAPQSIAGVISDFCLGNITDGTKPVMLRFMKPDDTAYMVVAEVQGDLYDTVKEIEAAYTDVTGGMELMGSFLDQNLQGSFQSQIRLAKIVGVFTFVAVLISLLGLLAMSTYFIQQRSLEVAVRKVFGSDNRQILTQLVKTFLMYVVFAFFLAVPVAYYFMSDWLADYSYRITLNPFIFIGAGLFCLIISFLTVFYQSWKAANANPIESFRNKNQ